jgi:hypothetical protein
MKLAHCITVLASLVSVSALYSSNTAVDIIKTKDDFKERVTKSDEVVFVEFYAPVSKFIAIQQLASYDSSAAHLILNFTKQSSPVYSPKYLLSSL